MAFRPSMGGIGSLDRKTSVSGVGEPMNTDELIAHLVEMTPTQRSQYAAAHSGDSMLLSVAKYVDNKFKEDAAHLAARQNGTLVPVNQQAVASMAGAQTEQVATGANGGSVTAGLPEESGIGALPVPEMKHMADGGIVAFGDGGDVPGYAAGGKSKADPVQDFATKYRALAEQAGEAIGVDPGLIIAQWGHETGWGRGIPGKHNLGNIKGKGTEAYDSIEKSRSQYKNYESPEAFVQDYVSQIKRNFPNAVGAGRDVKQFTKGLQKGRLGAYATDPDYAKKMASAVTKVLPIGSAQAQETAPATAPAEADQTQRAAGARDATTADLQALRKSPNLGDKVDTVGQVLRSLGQNAFARVAGGLSGLAGAMTPGAEGQGADYAKKVQEYLSYYPEAITEDTKTILGILGVPLEYANKYVGVPAGDYLAAQGLPVAASFMRAVPEVVLAAGPLALRGGKVTGGAKPAAAPAATPAAAVRTVPTPAQVAAGNPPAVKPALAAPAAPAAAAAPPLTGLARVNQAANLRKEAAAKAAQEAGGAPLPPATGLAALAPKAAALRANAVAQANARAAARTAEAEAAAGKAAGKPTPTPAPAAAPAAATAAVAPVSRMAAARAAIGEGGSRVGKGLPGLVPAMIAAGTGVSNQEAPPEPVGGAGAANPMELDPALRAALAAGEQEPVSIAKEPVAEDNPNDRASAPANKAAEAAPAKNPEEWTADDWLALAAGLGKNESQYATKALSSGLEALVANRTSRKKVLAEAAAAQSLEEQKQKFQTSENILNRDATLRAAGISASAPSAQMQMALVLGGGNVETGMRKMTEIAAGKFNIQDAYANYLKSMGPGGMGVSPQEFAAQIRALTPQIRP